MRPVGLTRRSSIHHGRTVRTASGAPTVVYKALPIQTDRPIGAWDETGYGLDIEDSSSGR